MRTITRWRAASTLALVLVCALVVACGAPDDEAAETEAVTEPADDEPADAPDVPAAEDSGDGEGVTEATAYFVRYHEGEHWVEPETQELERPTVAVGRTSMEVLVAGEFRNPDLTTLVPENTRVLDVGVDGGVMTVDFSGELAAASGASAQEVALANQLVHTATQFETVDALLVWIDGEPIDELWGHVDWSEPLEPPPYAVSPIVFTSPRWGETVPQGPVTVAGHSLTFEANVVLHLVDPDGVVVEETFTTAAQPAVDERGDFTLTFATEADRPGTWTVIGIEEDASDGEGRPPLTTTLEFEVE